MARWYLEFIALLGTPFGSNTTWSRNNPRQFQVINNFLLVSHLHLHDVVTLQAQATAFRVSPASLYNLEYLHVLSRTVWD